MTEVHESLREKLCEEAGCEISEFRGQKRVVIHPRWVFEGLRFLKEESGYDMLFELTCVDYLYFPDAKDRFGVIYGLLNTKTGERLIVKTFVNDPDPALQSVVPLWPGANWLEREVYDMYGVRFDGHPDLRRILMPDEFAAFPLRKDYPLRGRGERHNFPVLARSDG